MYYYGRVFIYVTFLPFSIVFVAFVIYRLLVVLNTKWMILDTLMIPLWHAMR